MWYKRNSTGPEAVILKLLLVCTLGGPILKKVFKIFLLTPTSICIWYKIKLTLRPPCFVEKNFLADGVLETTFKVPIFKKIYI